MDLNSAVLSFKNLRKNHPKTKLKKGLGYSRATNELVMDELILQGCDKSMAKKAYVKVTSKKGSPSKNTPR